jgi:hypothetical protein
VAQTIVFVAATTSLGRPADQADMFDPTVPNATFADYSAFQPVSNLSE